MQWRVTKSVAGNWAARVVRSVSWASLLSLITAGCVSGRPWAVRIEGCPPPRAADRQGADTTRLSVTTFNVWGLPAWINGASPSRQARIASRLDELGSDIVLLQEVWTRQSYEVLSRQSNGESQVWWSAAARRKRGFLGQNGLLTLSKYPIESAEFRPFTAASLPDSLMHKGALRVTLAIRPGQRVNVWNVHLQDGKSTRVRSHQIAELVRWIDEAADGEVADIVGGDFNLTPGSEEFDRFVAAVGMSVYELAGAAPLPTWDGLKRQPRAGLSLDHIFVRVRRPAQEIASQPRRIFCASRREDRLSDHMGVEALLTIRSREANRPPVLVWRSSSPALPEATASVHR